jgi:benzodiazapine receptor
MKSEPRMVCLAIAATTVAFFRRSRIADWLMVPYLAWVSFAGVLNFTIWRLNVGWGANHFGSAEMCSFF